MSQAEQDAPPLAVERVVAGYGRRRVLDGISLTVRQGEIFGLIGLNGAGKTTLIKALLALHPVRAGTIRLFGRDHGKSDGRAALAFLPELFSPSAYLRGIEFLELSQASYDLPLDRPAAETLCQALELDPALLGKRVTSYSKGMGQKLGLIATLLTERKLLVLDEPMSGLDPLARTRLKDALAAYRAQGRSVFLSSHILADLDELCDRIAILHDGALPYLGTPAELRAAQDGLTLERAFLKVIGA